MKKTLYITPFVCFIIILFMFDRYSNYHGADELTIMTFFIIPTLLFIIMFGIANVISRIENIEKKEKE